MEAVARCGTVVSTSPSTSGRSARSRRGARRACAATRARGETRARGRDAAHVRAVRAVRHEKTGARLVLARGSETDATMANEDDARAATRGLPPRVLVEAAMLAALTGLAFHISSLFRFDAYFGALFPLPVVIACARSGRAAAMRTLIVASLLLLMISGPLRALNYFFLHGVLAYVLSSLWSSGASWWITVPASALTRTFGILTSLSISSLLYRENVMKLLVTQMYSLLDQFAANVGASFAPTIGWVWATALFFIIINSFSYTLILHMVYTIVLNATTGRNFVNAPLKVCRTLGVSSAS
jgi:hypothetical protein